MASEPLKQLIAACRAGDVDGVGRLVAAGPAAETAAVSAAEVRKSGYGCFVEACLAGHTAIAADLVRVFNITAAAVCDPAHDIFGAICRAGSHPDVTGWFVYKFGLERDSVTAHHAAGRAFRDVCAAGRLPVARWLTQHFELTAADARADDCWALRHACIGGHLQLASWMVTKFGLNGADARSLRNFALRWACIRGQLETARWLVVTFELGAADARDDDNYALRHCCFRGQLTSVSWLVEHFGLTATDVGARNGEALRWARENGHDKIVECLNVLG